MASLAAALHQLGIEGGPNHRHLWVRRLDLSKNCPEWIRSRDLQPERTNTPGTKKNIYSKHYIALVGMYNLHMLNIVVNQANDTLIGPWDRFYDMKQFRPKLRKNQFS
jgi:hypothetical protein